MVDYPFIRNFSICALLTMLSGAAIGGGLYLTEFGDPVQGASGAGAGVLAQDASTAFHNPAGIMLLEPGKNYWMISGLYVDPSAEFSKELPGTTVEPVAPGVGNGGDAGVSAVGGGFWWSRRLNENFGLGFSLNSMSAATLDYTEDFVGRYWAKDVELLTINLMPSAAYRVNDNWSVAIAIPVMLGRLDMDVRLPAAIGPQDPSTDGQVLIKDGDDVSAGVALFSLWEATERLRFGIGYLSENKMEFSSDVGITLPAGVTLPDIKASVDIPFVQTVRFWGSSDIGDRLTILASVAWEDWSSFDNVLITTDTGSSALERNWRDTWKFALGLRWRTGGAWSHYAGVAYDTSPTNAANRTADMPLDEQWRFSVGTNYTMQNGVAIGGAVTYADYGDAAIDNGSANWGNVVGEYTTNRILFLGFNVGW